MASLSHIDLLLLKMERAIMLTSPRPVGVQPELWKLEYRRLARAWEDIVAGRDPTALTAVEVTAVGDKPDTQALKIRLLAESTFLPALMCDFAE